MLSKKDLEVIKLEMLTEFNHQGESADFRRGLRAVSIIIHDVLRDKGKNDTANLIVL